jgi:hypothetical protein
LAKPPKGAISTSRYGGKKAALRPIHQRVLEVVNGFGSIANCFRRRRLT